MSKKSKAERRQMMTRIVCLALAGVMVGSVLLAAILSQIF